MTEESSTAMSRATIYRQAIRHFFSAVAEELYNDDRVTEVLINGHDKIYVERNNQLEVTDKRFESADALQAAVNNLAEYVNRRLDLHHHSMDARLPEPEQFRVHVITPPCSRQGIVVSIRKFKRAELTVQRLVETGSISALAMQFLEIAIRLHRNIIVSGGTSTGKTSLLNALSTFIPKEERIIVIEDSSELQLRQPHTVYLEVRPPHPDGTGGVSIRDLFIDSLRMRPDRIIVGEVRRGEALDMIQSMLSGHDGAMSTVHASSPRLALLRLETLCLMSELQMPVYVARTQVASAIHLVVQVSRTTLGRQVTAISEVRELSEKGEYQIVDLFRLNEPDEDEAEHAGQKPLLIPTDETCTFSKQARSFRVARDPKWGKLFAL